MFTSPAPAPVSLVAAAAAATNAASASSQAFSQSSTAPSSTSRTRRGLTALRNYTQNHLLSRDHAANSTAVSPTGATSPTSAFSRSAPGLTRSNSENQPSSAAATRSARDLDRDRSHRFTLVPAQTHPLEHTPSAPSTSLFDHQPSISAAAASTAYHQHPSTGAHPPASQGQQPSGRRSMTRSRSATTGTIMAANTSNRAAEDGNQVAGILPSIRFSVFVDPRSTRPSLTFSPIARTLPTGTEIIRVGRYSERDSQPAVPANVPSSAPVGFKSKVVSRRHCEFWYEDGKWYIKDVKSSSGTFLNHIRLSPPGQESKPFPVNDGDVVQLGIDFKGGEEMIFRCVKMRLELNRGWQNKLNKFKYVPIPLNCGFRH